MPLAAVTLGGQVVGELGVVDDEARRHAADPGRSSCGRPRSSPRRSSARSPRRSSAPRRSGGPRSARRPSRARPPIRRRSRRGSRLRARGPCARASSAAPAGTCTRTPMIDPPAPTAASRRSAWPACELPAITSGRRARAARARRQVGERARAEDDPARERLVDDAHSCSLQARRARAVAASAGKNDSIASSDDRDVDGGAERRGC